MKNPFYKMSKSLVLFVALVSCTLLITILEHSFNESGRFSITESNSSIVEFIAVSSFVSLSFVCIFSCIAMVRNSNLEIDELKEREDRLKKKEKLFHEAVDSSMKNLKEGLSSLEEEFKVKKRMAVVTEVNIKTGEKRTREVEIPLEVSEKEAKEIYEGLINELVEENTTTSKKVKEVVDEFISKKFKGKPDDKNSSDQDEEEQCNCPGCQANRMIGIDAASFETQDEFIKAGSILEDWFTENSEKISEKSRAMIFNIRDSDDLNDPKYNKNPSILFDSPDGKLRYGWDEVHNFLIPCTQEQHDVIVQMRNSSPALILDLFMKAAVVLKAETEEELRNEFIEDAKKAMEQGKMRKV